MKNKICTIILLPLILWASQNELTTREISKDSIGITFTKQVDSDVWQIIGKTTAVDTIRVLAIMKADTQPMLHEVITDGEVIEYYTRDDDDLLRRCRGVLKNGKEVGIWIQDNCSKSLLDTNNWNLFTIEHYNDIGKQTKVEYFKDGKKDKTEHPRVGEFFRSCFDDYQLGVQPPIMINADYPLGASISSLNFNFQIPMPQYDLFTGDTRASAAAAAEIGVRGYALRAGLAPFEDNHFTPLTLNASFSRFWKDHDNKVYPDTKAGMWYYGADIDWSGNFHTHIDNFPLSELFFLTHFRLGFMVPEGGSVRNDAVLSFSAGFSPGVFAVFFMGGM